MSSASDALGRAWLALIITFHAWSALTMGIYSFGAVMTAANLFMLRDAELAALGAWLPRPRWVRASAGEGATGG